MSIYVHTRESIMELAGQCQTLAEFTQRFNGAYRAAFSRGMLPELHEILKSSPLGPKPIFTDEALRASAAKYQTRKEWQEGAPREYLVARYSSPGFMTSICEHMKKLTGLHRRNIKYTDEALEASAAKFSTKVAWKRGAHREYQAASRWRTPEFYDRITAHMTPGVDINRAYVVYRFTFPDGAVYVGLTMRQEARYAQHYATGPVYRYMHKTGTEPVFQVVASGLDWRKAREVERGLIAAARALSTLLLNTADGGGLGTLHPVKWTKNAILVKAREYETRQAWIDDSQHTYKLAKEKGWYDEASAHMPKRDNARPDKWTHEAVLADAKRFEQRARWMRGSGSAYSAALKYGWLEEACAHMVQGKATGKPPRSLTPEETACIQKLRGNEEPVGRLTPEETKQLSNFRRKTRYETDPVYRAKCIARASASKKDKSPETALMPT